MKTRSGWLPKFGLRFLGFLSLLIVWQVVASLKIYNPYLFPPPSQVGKAFVAMLRSGEWLEDILSSLGRYFCGFLLGVIIGIATGILTGKFISLGRFLNPVLNFFRSIPTIALVPLAIVWFGINEQEKILVIFWGAFFPVWLNTYMGVAEVETEYIWAARSLGARGLKIISTVYLKRSIPFIIAGIRVAIATGFFALASAEMTSSFNGIAYKIFQSHQLFRTDKMFVYIITIGALSVAFDRLLVLITNYYLPWAKVKREYN